MIEALGCWPGNAGVPPSFARRTRRSGTFNWLMTSTGGAGIYLADFASSQIRMAYCAPIAERRPHH